MSGNKNTAIENLKKAKGKEGNHARLRKDSNKWESRRFLELRYKNLEGMAKKFSDESAEKVGVSFLHEEHKKNIGANDQKVTITWED